MLRGIRNIIVGIIDFFHKPFSRFINAQTFRYLSCGGGNTVLGLVLYSIIFVHVLHQKDLHIMGYLLTARVAALCAVVCVTTPLGFVLSSYVVFPESQIHGRVQLFRYIVTTLSFIFLSYVLTKLFAICIPMVRADIANIFVCIITAVLSYLTQRFFTFKITKEEEIQDEAVA